jgi:hypothetical protein
MLGQWRALPQRAAQREVQKPKQPFGLQIVQQISNFRGLGCSRTAVACDQHDRTAELHNFAFSLEVYSG